jgi:hypothetical protein
MTLMQQPGEAVAQVASIAHRSLEQYDGQETRVRVHANFPSNFKAIPHVQTGSKKYSAFHVGQINFIPRAIPSRSEGRWPSSRTLGRDAVDAAASGA